MSVTVVQDTGTCWRIVDHRTLDQFRDDRFPKVGKAGEFLDTPRNGTGYGGNRMIYRFEFVFVLIKW